MQNNYLDFKIIFEKLAQKNLDNLPHEEQLKILEKINFLKLKQENLDIKKLQGFKNLYRIRSGDYRIVYSCDNKNKIFSIELICHRQDVYKLLKKIFGLIFLDILNH